MKVKRDDYYWEWGATQDILGIKVGVVTKKRVPNQLIFGDDVARKLLYLLKKATIIMAGQPTPP